MRKIFSILLLCCVVTHTFASQENQDQGFGKLELKKECSIPTLDFSFDEMQLSSLDVYAPEQLALSFVTPKTCEGFQVVAFKPPVDITAGIIGTKTKQFISTELFRQGNYLDGNFLSKNLSR